MNYERLDQAARMPVVSQLYKIQETSFKVDFEIYNSTALA